MYLTASRNISIDSSNTTPFQKIVEQKEADSTLQKDKNWLRIFHRSGIRAHDHVLVVGSAELDMLQKLAKTVGWRGKITLIDDNQTRLEQTEAHYKNGEIAAIRPAANFPPVMDFRISSEKLKPIDMQFLQINGHPLPFEAKTFDHIWVLNLPESLSSEAYDSFADELFRTIK